MLCVKQPLPSRLTHLTSSPCYLHCSKVRSLTFREMFWRWRVVFLSHHGGNYGHRQTYKMSSLIIVVVLGVVYVAMGITGIGRWIHGENQVKR